MENNRDYYIKELQRITNQFGNLHTKLKNVAECQNSAWKDEVKNRFYNKHIYPTVSELSNIHANQVSALQEITLIITDLGKSRK
ncbi:MAG: hypothetical protein EBR54_04310 [Flavobacteriia bacterium]|nr:hypothetical protein [Flavobacteriia bacterium]